MFPRQLIVSLLALIFVAPTAHAQIGAAAGIAEYMNPYFLRRDLKLITEIFELDEGQQAVFEAFYFEYGIHTNKDETPPPTALKTCRLASKKAWVKKSFFVRSSARFANKQTDGTTTGICFWPVCVRYSMATSWPAGTK